MEFIDIKNNATCYLVDYQSIKAWEGGYLTVCYVGGDILSYIKMEDLKPIYTQEDTAGGN